MRIFGAECLIAIYAQFLGDVDEPYYLLFNHTHTQVMIFNVLIMFTIVVRKFTGENVFATRRDSIHQRASTEVM